MKNLLLAFCALMFSIGTAWAAVNANTASVDELQTVTGIGPTIAQRIVDERKKGPFKDLSDLEQRVKGVGEGNIKKMAAGGLTVGGSSRAKPESSKAASAKAESATPAAKSASPAAKSDAAAGRDAAAKSAAAKDTASTAAAPKAAPKADAPAAPKAAAPAAPK